MPLHTNDTHRAPDRIDVVVGYSSYGEMNALNDLRAGSSARIVSAGSDLQDVVDAVAEFNPQIVLLNPTMRRYVTDYIQDLLYRDDNPIPVVGYVMNDTTNQAAVMKK